MSVSMSSNHSSSCCSAVIFWNTPSAAFWTGSSTSAPTCSGHQSRVPVQRYLLKVPTLPWTRTAIRKPQLTAIGVGVVMAPGVPDELVQPCECGAHVLGVKHAWQRCQQHGDARQHLQPSLCVCQLDLLRVMFVI